MVLNSDRQWASIETLKVAIARSPILLPRRWTATILRPQLSRRQHLPLPAGFDKVDAAILEWIATEARRGRRGMVRV